MGNAMVDSTRPTRYRWIRALGEVGIGDVGLVGGKNASLGEMLRELSGLGVAVPDGFAVTVEGFFEFLNHNQLVQPIAQLLDELEPSQVEDLERRSRQIRSKVLKGQFPPKLEGEINQAYQALSKQYGEEEVEVAVRSSATAEDLPGASFAGAHETLLNVRGEHSLQNAIRQCFASLYTPRAIGYRMDMGFAHTKVGLSVGVQKMLASSEAVSGVIFTLDTETGFRDVVQLNAIWGLGENIVQGRVIPDEFYIHKPTLEAGFKPLLWKKLGAKEFRLIYDPTTHRHQNLPVIPAERGLFCLSDEEVLKLARWAVLIEQHYSSKNGRPTPMDIEFAKDGAEGGLYIVQARPETVHSIKQHPTLSVYELQGQGRVLLEGQAIGEKIASGKTRVIADPSAMREFKAGEILITQNTNPDWEPIMKIASAIVTESGGRTSHAAIVARELGIPAIVGAAHATERVKSGLMVTVSCAEGEKGHLYEGNLQFKVQEIDPAKLPQTRTKIMMNLGNPDQAFKLALIPNDGVGLARMEFIFADWVGIHPMALLQPELLSNQTRLALEERTQHQDGGEYFVDRLAQGIAVLAAAFYPRPVILRFSDFKTNEYAKLLGGELFEPKEENPMLGWRGASRYYHPDYKAGFLLEVAAVKRVREVMGLVNLKVMIPFCRTVEEAQQVLAVMSEGGLVRGENGLEVYMMAEIPSNIILAETFSEYFDGFSIGSNDLTQLILGVDRDSTMVAAIFNERNPAVMQSCAELIRKAHAHGRSVGICGQAPSDFPDFAAFLVKQGIDSISLNPDSILKTKVRIYETEQALLSHKA